MKKALFAVLAIAASVSAFAQQPATPTDVKEQGKIDQARIKAHKKVDEAVSDEARANVDAEAKATDKKLKAHHKAQKKIDDAASDVAKAQAKADEKAAKETR